MKEALVSAAVERIGTSSLERLAWAVDFSQRALSTREDVSRAELELTCFVFASHLFPDMRGQIRSLMTNAVLKELRYQPQDVIHAQRQFLQVLKNAAGEGEGEMLLKYVIVRFSRAEGLDYVSTIPGWSAVRSITGEQRAEARLEIATFKLLRLLDHTVRAENGRRHIPLRMYVGICPEQLDGCGKLFAKTRIDQEHCTRTCTVRHNVRRFRRSQREAKQKNRA